MNRRSFLAASARHGGRAGAGPRLAAGGGVVALVTADLESHVVAVDLGSGRVVKRIRTAAGPRSIESSPFGSRRRRAHRPRARQRPRLGDAVGALGAPRLRRAALHRHAPERAARVRHRLRARRRRDRRPRPAGRSSIGLRSVGRPGTCRSTPTAVALDGARNEGRAHRRPRPRLTRAGHACNGLRAAVPRPRRRLSLPTARTCGSRRARATRSPSTGSPAARRASCPRTRRPSTCASPTAGRMSRAARAGLLRVRRHDGPLTSARRGSRPGRTTSPTATRSSRGGRAATVTPSLDRGTLCVLTPAGASGSCAAVARSAHDACIVEAG